MTFYITMMLAAMLLLLPIYLLARWLWRRRRLQQSARREALLAIFVMFCGGMAILLFDGFSPGHYRPEAVQEVLARRFATGEAINLVPFQVITRYFELIHLYGDSSGLFVTNLVGNFAMFVPIGFGLPLLWRRWQGWKKMIPLAVLLPVCIETFQLILPRSVDIDDVLLNAGGILAGWGLYCLARHLWPRIAVLAAPRGGKNSSQKNGERPRDSRPATAA